MDLFISPKLQFEKVAAEYTLPEDPNAWQNEILQEVFKQVPYIADFEPNVVMDKVDAERGYGFGHIEVSNKTEIQPGASVAGLEAAGIKHVKIPIVVKNGKLQPFDIMVNEANEVLPLTEHRLRSAIFRPQAFDITGRSPGDQSMVGQLYPPFRQNFGFGGGGQTMSVGMGKEGAAKCCAKCGKEKCACMGKSASILATILPTILPEHYEDFFSKIAQEDIQAAFISNRICTEPSIKKLAQWELNAFATPEVTPTIVQISKTYEGYAVKTANHGYWAPKTETWDRGQICKTFGTKIAFDVDTAGSMTMGLDAPKEAPNTEVDKYEPIKDFGMYKVRTDDGKELVGYVFSNLIDVDGTPLPLFLFTNGSEKAVQADMVGVSAGSGASLFEGAPRGTGCFYRMMPNGKAQATIPMTIVATLGSAEEGVVMHARTFDGRQVEVEVQPNIANIMGVGDQKMIVPDSMCWLPLDAAKDVSLVSEPEVANEEAKTASFNDELTIEIRSSGRDSFALSGAPIEKVANHERHFLTFDEALFLLGGAGVDLKDATNKLASAQFNNVTYSVQASRGITTAEDVQADTFKLASAALAQVPDLRKDLVKEAATIPDPTAVDTVLSLGFINPENISSFIAYLPKIDGAQKKMCELLLASRLGIRDLPISALEKAVRSTEEVIQGLKVLAFQEA